MPIFDLYEELRAIVRGLESGHLEFAVCGAVALAVHGHPRATTDIDILVPADGVADVKAVLRGLGYDLEAAPMTFNNGIAVHRLSRVEGRELVTVDLLAVTEPLMEVWNGRVQLSWRDGSLPVVSREGLVAMKRMANRLRDRADLEVLGEHDDE